MPASNTLPPELIRIIDRYAPEPGISDIHLAPGLGVWITTNKQTLLIPGSQNWVTEQHLLAAIEATAEGGVARYENEKQIDASAQTDRTRLRLAFRKTNEGLTLTCRFIPLKIPKLDKQEAPEVFEELFKERSGLIIMVGPTGSGKSTILAAGTESVRQRENAHIYTVEDPIEFVYPQDGKLVTQREVGVDVLSFAAGIVNAKRSHPDVILVGELRDRADVRAALSAASSGHLVLTTFHAGSVTEAIEGLIGIFAAEEQSQIRTELSSSLLAIMLQLLIPDVDGGIVAARELAINTPAFRSTIRSGSHAHLIHADIDAGGRDGMFTLEQNLANLVITGRIDEKTALTYSKDPTDLKIQLKEFRRDQAA